MSFLNGDEPGPGDREGQTQSAVDHETGEVFTGFVEPAAVSESEVRAAFLGWLREHLLTLEPVDNGWCPQWWEHPEAVARLFALWLAWEAATAEDADLSDRSSWWVYHWGHHGPILLDRKNGPFRDCDAQRGHLARATRDHVRMKMAYPPASWTPDQRQP